MGMASALDEYLDYWQKRQSEGSGHAYAREVERVFWQVYFASIKVRESLAKKIELDRSLGKNGPVPPETGIGWKERIEREGFSEHGEEASAEALRECVFSVQAFYRCAFRLKEVLCLLPGLRRIDPPGIRRVRNQGGEPLISASWSPVGAPQRGDALPRARGRGNLPGNDSGQRWSVRASGAGG
jgi:hypothetical protein